MYKLPKEISLIIKISLIVSAIMTIILLIIKPIYSLNFILGYFASLISLIKNNYFVTAILYKIYPSSRRTMITSNLLSLLLYLLVLGGSFFMGLVNGIICAVGIFVIKIIILIFYGFSRKEGDQN